MDFSDDLNYSDLCYINFYIKYNYKQYLFNQLNKINNNDIMLNLQSLQNYYYYYYYHEYKFLEFNFLLDNLNCMRFSIDENYYII